MRRTNQIGATLIEMVIFIIVVGVATAGILSALSNSVRGSADPMLHKQGLAIAEALLAEIEQQAFSYCDPDDPAAKTANSTADCTNGAAGSQDRNGGALGPTNVPSTTAETRSSATVPFDNVADYAGFSMANVTDIAGNNAMAGYSISVAITRAGGAAPFATLPVDAVLRIQVTVSSTHESFNLTGYRFRYAPQP